MNELSILQFAFEEKGSPRKRREKVKEEKTQRATHYDSYITWQTTRIVKNKEP